MRKDSSLLGLMPRTLDETRRLWATSPTYLPTFGMRYAYAVYSAYMAVRPSIAPLAHVDQSFSTASRAGEQVGWGEGGLSN